MPQEFKPPPREPFLLSTDASAVPSVSSGFQPGGPESFSDWLKANIRELPVTLDLPDEVIAWIGKLASYWALAEWIQVGTLMRLLGAGRKEGRVILGPRQGNCLPKIKQLLEIKGIDFQVTYYQRLAELLKPCEEARNLLAHGVWLIEPDSGALCVQDPSGEWKVEGQPSISKRKYPEAFHPTIPWFEEAMERVKAAIRALQKFDLDIDSALATLKEKGG